ncbi:hypothetical protein KGF57_005361 [Candida theae]|uniref:Uncharacterized protein n=1 Tax=Candida theae TaxID=1198502 RepID=A0AAD5B9P1_9ASCO|nr:uncharacterized protein KGF57_005361 [Candida theae]KAI5948616.1 hypothetical protein KGF57_005361 [Candida theae]
MNVTSNGYYTTQYLNQHQRRPNKHIQSANEEEYRTPRTPYENLQSQSAPNPERSERALIMRNVRPKQYIHSDSSTSSQSSNKSSTIQSLQVEVDPEDQLEEEPTPAELKQIHEESIVITPVETQKDHRNKKGEHFLRGNKNDDYYLKQKQRYDEAEEVKPKMYTHKTFREVFSDKQEDMKRYNPIDCVFATSEDTVGPNKPIAKVSAFLKNIKVIKNDYNDYNYYDHRKRKRPDREIFVDDAGDDDDDDDDDDDYEDQGTEDESVVEKGCRLENNGAKSNKKKRTFKSVLKRKMNRAKKELGRDFDSHINGAYEHDVSSTDSLTSSTKEEIVNQNQNSTNGANNQASGDEFAITSIIASSYNYLWSWYEFYQNRSPHNQPQQSTSNDDKVIGITTKSVNDATSQKPKGKKRARFANGSKQLFTNWNQPANRTFRNGTKAKRGPRIIYPRGNDSSVSTAPSSEFIVEYDSSEEDSMTQELYYNPQTKQLEAEPPTSSQSMLTTSTTATTTKNRPSSPSLATVSNLLNLIKRIHIMQLIFTPIDFIADHFPQLQTVIIVLELVLFVWILYELSRLVDALCMMVRAFCSPMIAMGRFMNKIM